MSSARHCCKRLSQHSHTFEHHPLNSAAKPHQVGNWPKAGALYEQQAALLRGAGMKGKLLYHLYTYSTLLFIRSLLVLSLPLLASA